MEKTARKPSTDPIQEKLRQNKTNWNKEVSSFINDLIHFKKTMNGWPSKFHKERSRIVEPIPSDPATIIGSLAGDFQEIVNKGNGIIQEQLNYAKNRKKKQPKQLNLPFKPVENQTPSGAAPTSPQTNSQEISKQLELGLAADNAYQLLSLASNPLTRFFTRLLNPSMGNSEAARIKRYRKSLLNASAQMYRDLKRMQDAVVSSGPESIFLSNKLLDKIENNWVFIVSGFQTYVNTLPNGAVDTGGQLDSPSNVGLDNKNTDTKINKGLSIVQDIQNHSNNFSGIPALSELRELAKKFFVGSNTEKLQLVDDLINKYQQVLVTLSNSKQIPVQKSLADISSFETSNKVASSQDLLQVVAQTFLKKLRHQISPFDKTSSFRIDVYNMLEECKSSLDQVMNVLEAGFDENKLQELFKDINDKLKNVKTLMHGLSSTIKGLGYQPEFINMLEKGKLGDHEINLDKKQKENLDRMLKLKQIRDLTKMYAGK